MAFVMKSETSKIVGLPIGVLMGRNPVQGDVGIEIEMEGNKFPKESLSTPWWVYHKDGSLRGNDNAEYVLRKPIPFDMVDEAVASLWQMLNQHGSVLDDSNRTSVHVHLNVQNWHMNRLAAFAGLYYSVEEALTAWCGEHRVGNLFCLRGKDATATLTILKKFIKADGASQLTDGLHYAGLNVSAIPKFGSVEVRTLRGVNDPEVILKWVAILRRIYELSEKFPDPRDVPPLLSEKGPLDYFDYVFGPLADSFKQDLNWTSTQIRSSTYEGIRLAQDICYCREWEEFAPIAVKQDPFKRDIKQVATALQASFAQPTTINFATIAPAPRLLPKTTTEKRSMKKITKKSKEMLP